ncbi:unnamed protein product [Brassica rapa]|uniref:Uncharacterized protein n=1 Tax=Brassica campestris TaxID=3711 RepID=A0A8D9HUK5_BRACM|nr:unnamed protein product [Brassica rapa]
MKPALRSANHHHEHHCVWFVVAASPGTRERKVTTETRWRRVMIESTVKFQHNTSTNVRSVKCEGEEDGEEKVREDAEARKRSEVKRLSGEERITKKKRKSKNKMKK